MITTKKIIIKINSSLTAYYRNLGYKFEFRGFAEININDLTKGSHTKVDIECDICNKTLNIEFRGCHKHLYEIYECRSCLRKRLIVEGKVHKFNSEMNIEISKNTKIKMLCPIFKDKVLKKTRKTKLEKYNNETYNNQENRLETMITNHGKYFNNQEKRLETMIINHGKYFNNQEKKRETIFYKYGVYHTNHVPEIFNKIKKNGFKICLHQETNLNYQGTYEKDFLIFCYNNSIMCEEFKSNIPYGNHKYYPDFYYRPLNLIIEIKSWYTYERDLEKNLLKQKACLDQGYNFLFIKDKQYDEFLSMTQTINSIK